MQLNLQLSYTVETDKAKILISIIVIQRFSYDSVLKSYVKSNIRPKFAISFVFFFIRLIQGDTPQI